MTVYNTLADFATAYVWLPADVAEYCYGKDAAKQSRIAKSGTSWSIRENGDWREASPNESTGIRIGLIELAEALAAFGVSDDDLDALLASECNCSLPDQSCPACRATARTIYGKEA